MCQTTRDSSLPADDIEFDTDPDDDTAPQPVPELQAEDLPINDVSGEDNSGACAREIQVQAAQFLSFVKEECCTTQRTVDSVIKGVDELFKLYHKYLKTKISELSGSSSDVVQKKDVLALLDYLSQQTLFEGVHTAYRLEKYQAQKWKALVPIQLVMKWKRRVVHGNVMEVPHKFAYYVDFLSQLELVLQCKDILSCVDNPKVSNDGSFRCALDGYIYQNHPVRIKHQNAIGIILYLDDALTLESLTSYQDHSIRNFSWTIANIPPEMRSSVRAINLLALAKTSVAKECRNGPILDNFIEGVNRLSSDEGVKLTIRGVARVFYGFLLFVIGDYPALANIGGWKESAAFAWRFCRQCMVSRQEFQTKFKESEVLLRSADMHQQHLAAISGTVIEEEEEENSSIEQTAEEPSNPSVKFGVNFESPLLKVKYFDVTKCLPQDIMHLFLEGIMEYGCRLLINHAIDDKKLSLKTVNHFLNVHEYGKLRTDKPSPIQPQHLKNGLRQTSSQMLMLCFLVPFIVKGHCDNKKLENYILLLMIFSMCMSHLTDISRVEILKRMIENYLLQFSLLYPGKLLPKHHFLIHLPTQIILFSVLTEQWAMRFEAFFSKLKRLTKLLHNAKNLSCSLMIRVCANQSFQIHRHQECFLRTTLVIPKLKQIVPLSSNPHKECLLSVLNLSDETEISELVCLKWFGSVFSQGDTIVVRYPSTHEDLPEFATVVQIYSHENTYVFVYRLLKTVSFCLDVNAYHVKCMPWVSLRACDITNMSNLQQLMHVRYGSEDYVLLRRNSQPNFGMLGLEM